MKVTELKSYLQERGVSCYNLKKADAVSVTAVSVTDAVSAVVWAVRGGAISLTGGGLRLVFSLPP